MRPFRLLLASILVVPAAVGALPAESDAPPPGRPRTVLVLSGGGARGAAHVGVLRVLEEQRVPVDLVVGTSMGAVVGGLWAAGRTPEELTRALLDEDWQGLFDDRPPRRELSFRRKQDDGKPLFRFELGIGKNGFILPSGLIAGHKLGKLLRQQTLPVSQVEDFDRLPVPFRAVAADLTRGELVVLGSGDLARALRASMSVPGVLSPVEIDDRVLVDGGLVSNLPVRVARELGARRIIAVDVSTPLEGTVRSGSIFGVAGKAVDLLTDANVRVDRELLAAADLLLSPRLDGVETTDFDLVKEAIRRGEEAARESVETLATFSVDAETWRRWKRSRNTTVAPAGITIDAVKIEGLERFDERAIRRRIRSRAGEPFDGARAAEDLERIFRVGDFERVDYDLRTDGTTELVYDVREKSWGPNFLQFGMALESDFRETSDFTVLAEFTRTALNSLGAEWKTTGTAGDVNSVVSEFFQPLDYGGFAFVAPRVEIVRIREERFLEDETIEDTRNRWTLGGVDFGVQLRNWGEVRVGFRNGTVESERRGTPAGVEESRADIGGIVVQGILDQLDATGFPRAGARARVDYFGSRRGLDATVDYDRLAVEGTQVGSFGRHTIVGRARFGTGLGSTLPEYNDFELGGFLDLSGLRPNELRGDRLGFAQLAYYARVSTLPSALGTGMYLGGAIEAGNVWAEADPMRWSDLRGSAAVFVGADTILGPIYVGHGRTEDGDASFYLFFGRAFF